MSGDSVTKNDLDEVETKLGRRIDEVETKLGRRIDEVEAKVDIVARQVGSLTERVDTITATIVTRDDLAADLAAFRDEVTRDIARRMDVGFEMMRQLFTMQDDRAKSIEDKHGELRRDFTEHTRDMVLHNPLTR